MEATDLLLVCVAAFIAVFVILAGLAAVMRGLMAAFPDRPSKNDPAPLAAIAAAAGAAYPGMKIRSIEEDP